MRQSALLGVLLIGALVLFSSGCENKGSLRPFEPSELPDAFLQSMSADLGMIGLGGQDPPPFTSSTGRRAGG
jgi:hypothetical protein